MRTNKPEHVAVKNRRKAGQMEVEGGVKNVSESVRREPKSTGQQTVREGKTRADKTTKYCSSECTGEETAQTHSCAGDKSALRLVFKTSKIPMVQYYCVITARGAKD